MTKEFTKHDHFFNKVMSELNVARDFFKAYLPDEIKNEIDFTSLVLDHCDTKIVKDNLGSHEIADIIFKTRLADNLCFLLVHIEHQSTADKLMSLRVLNYASGALLKYASLHPKSLLPPIISLVYYHGKQHPYPYSMEILDLFDSISAAQKQHIFKPILIDLSNYDDHALKKHGDMAPVDILFKHIFDPNSKEIVELMLSSLISANPQIRFFGVQYIMKRVDLPREEFIDLALKYLDKENVMTVAEQIEEMVAKRVTEQVTQRERYAMARKLLKEGVSIDIISKCTHLSANIIKNQKTSKV